MLFVTLSRNVVVDKILVAEEDAHDTALLEMLRYSSDGADNIVGVPDNILVEIGWTYDGTKFIRPASEIEAELQNKAEALVKSSILSRLNNVDIDSITTVSQMLPVLKDLKELLLKIGLNSN